MFSFIHKLGKNDRSILYACFFAFLVNGVMTMMMGSAMPDLQLAYGLNGTVGGLLLSAHSAGNLVSGFLSGLIPLYLGRRRSVALLAALTALGFLMMLLWGNPVWLLVAFLFTGAGRGGVTNFDNHRVNLLSGGSPAATNLLHAVFAVGAICGPMLFLAGRGLFGWRTGLVLVVLMSAFNVWNLSRMQLSDDKPDRADKAQSTLSFLKNPSFLILALMMFSYLCAEYAINGWLVTYIQSKEALIASFGKTGEELARAIASYSQMMATLLWVVMLAGRLFCAALSAKVPQKILMMVSSFGAVAFFGVLLLSKSVTTATLSVVGLGFCMAGICPMIYSDASVFTNRYSMATGALLAIGSAGAIFMPTAVGALADRFGFAGGMSAIWGSFLLLAVVAVLNVTVKTRLPRE